jgi:hypothetical protein
LPNSSAITAASATEQNLAMKNVLADEGEDYRLKWEPISPAPTNNETAETTEAADAVGTVNLEENDNNNNNNNDYDYDHASGSR